MDAIKEAMIRDEDQNGTAEMAFIEALQKISEAKGAFKRDPYEHCQSCVRDMQALAIDVLAKHGITPRGKPVE